MADLHGTTDDLKPLLLMNLFAFVTTVWRFAGQRTAFHLRQRCSLRRLQLHGNQRRLDAGRRLARRRAAAGADAPACSRPAAGHLRLHPLVRISLIRADLCLERFAFVHLAHDLSGVHAEGAPSN